MVAPRSRPGSGGTRHAYEVIVLGGQLGGAVTAALLAKRGYRVLLIEHDGVGPGYEHGGYLLPFAPFLMPQLKTMPAVEAALIELALNTPVQRAIRQQQPLLQLAMPHQRVELNGQIPAAQGVESRKASLERQLGPTGATLDAELSALETTLESTQAFFRNLITGPGLPPDGMMEEWGLKSQVKKLPKGLVDSNAPFLSTGGPEAELLRGLVPFLHYGATTEGPFAGHRPLAQVIHGLGHYPGGREGLRQLICKKLLDLGGDILEAKGEASAIAESLLFDSSRVSGVQVLRNETPYRAQFVVGATDAQALRRLLPDKQKQKGLADLLDLSTTRRFLFAVNWVVKAEGLPAGMGELVLVDPGPAGAKDAQNLAVGPIILQVHPARKADGKEDPDARVVCGAAFVPAAIRDGGELHLKEVADSLTRQMRALMPFADRHRLLLSAPYLDAGGVRGSRLMPHPLYELATPAFLGVTGLPIRTPIKNLLLANREVLPTLGLEGEFMAALGAARRVNESLKKKNFLGG